MFPIINIGPLALPAPEFLLLIGFWIGLELTEKQAHRYRASSGQLYNLALIAAVAGLVGARLGYAARSPGAFVENPLNLLALTPQMLDLTGGLLFALLAALVYGRVRGMALWPNLDAAVTFFAILAVALGLSHLASGDAFGAPADLPWSLELWGERRHPSQVYEIIAALLIAAAVWPGGRISRASEHPGVRAENPLARKGLRFWAFVALTAGSRLILESFRGDSTLLLNSFRQAQVIAWLVLAVSLWQIGRRLPKAASAGPQAQEPQG